MDHYEARTALKTFRSGAFSTKFRLTHEDHFGRFQQEDATLAHLISCELCDSPAAPLLGKMLTYISERMRAGDERAEALAVSICDTIAEEWGLNTAPSPDEIAAELAQMANEDWRREVMMGDA